MICSICRDYSTTTKRRENGELVCDYCYKDEREEMRE